MGEEPLTVAALARFHREIVMPEFRREMDTLRTDIRAEFAGHLDAIYKRFDRLEIEYHAIVAGLKRIEERLDRVESADKLALKSELLELKARVEGLQAQVQALEERLSA